MGDKYNGSTNNLPNPRDDSSENSSETEGSGYAPRTLRDRTPKWVSGGVGGVAGALGTFLLLVIPVVNTWLANAREVSLAQIKNSADQIAYVKKRMEDSDKERDIYKSEMLSCQKELRELKK